jgi:SAM-dependent MidA family methyltransferase
VTLWRPWREAMGEALYGPDGFYRRTAAPARHFRTSAHVSPIWADAIRRLADEVDAAAGRPEDFAVVDLGAGGGELLAALADAAPDRWRLAGVELAPRPPGLPARVEWLAQLPERITGLLVAVEWLDVVPVDVVELDTDGPRLVEVDPAGRERLAGAPPPGARTWLDRWWPLADPGDRAEIGLSRDAAWREAVGHLGRGLAVAVDYAAVPGRDVGGTLTGYRNGRQCAPVPDGTGDLTAHVLLESCEAAAAVEAGPGVLLSQRDALRRLGVDGRAPAYGGDPARYLAALAAAGEAAELLDPGGLGGFGWLVHAKGIELAEMTHSLS